MKTNKKHQIRFIDPLTLPLWALNQYNIDETGRMIINEVPKATPDVVKVNRLRATLKQHQSVKTNFKQTFYN
jgi:hypothetical protein